MVLIVETLLHTIIDIMLVHYKIAYASNSTKRITEESAKQYK